MSDQEMNEDLVIRGSGDFLADQGIADPDEFRVKSHLCHEIATIAERRGLTAADIGRLAGEAEQDAERMMKYPHDGYDVRRLIKLLSALGADVGIYINRTSGHERGIVLSQSLADVLDEVDADGD
jgi:hypothetical protein